MARIIVVGMKIVKKMAAVMTEPKCLVNCTIPVKLRDFLKEHNVNRSELFRTAALQYYDLKICPYCYSHDIKETLKGWICQSEDYNSGCGKWLKFKNCELCDALHTPKSGAVSVEGKVGCDLCPEHIKEKEEKKLDAVFGNEL